METFPIKIYDGTSGWRGSLASQDRVLEDDSSGATAMRQKMLYRLVMRSMSYGVTWKECGEELGLHAGQSSAALSSLHKSHLIVRLEERRSRCSVYIMERYINERPVSDFKKSGKTKHELCSEIISIIEKGGDLTQDIDAIYELVNAEKGLL